MTTATAPTRPAAPAVPANPGYRLRRGRIPDAYLPDTDTPLTGWWLEGVDLDNCDVDWPATSDSTDPEIGPTAERQAQYWAAEFIRRTSCFTVSGWDFRIAGDPEVVGDASEEWLEPRLTVTRHTLRIFQQDDTTCWVFNTLYAHEVQAILSNLSDPDAVIELRDDEGTTHIPVRWISSARHVTVTEDVA